MPVRSKLAFAPLSSVILTSVAICPEELHQETSVTRMSEVLVVATMPYHSAEVRSS
jgi:hypothetical protein